MFHAFFTRPMTGRQMAAAGLLLSLCLLLCGAASALWGWQEAQREAGAAVCADTLRLHIRADSDSLADQSAKLAVRDAVLAYTDAACPAHDKAGALQWAAAHLPQLQLRAAQTLGALGVHVPVRVRLVEMYFHAASYGSSALPAGRYDAVRIELGANPRHGKNWWCVLYPGLCRSACGGYALPEENDLVCGEYILRFRAVDLWNRWTARREDTIYLGI